MAAQAQSQGCWLLSSGHKELGSHALRPQLVCECTVPYHPETGGGRDATTRDRAALRTDLYTLELERVDTQ